MRILRLEAPVRREAYDADLHRFRQEVARDYAAFAANLLAYPGQRTDILGALAVARQEFDEIPKTDRRALIVPSDFLEDDRQYRFTTDRELARAATAQSLAARLRRTHNVVPRGIAVYLGALQSSDFAALGPARQRAVQAFWNEYFAQLGQQVEIRMDGTGMLATLGAR